MQLSHVPAYLTDNATRKPTAVCKAVFSPCPCPSQAQTSLNWILASRPSPTDDYMFPGLVYTSGGTCRCIPESFENGLAAAAQEAGRQAMSPGS